MSTTEASKPLAGREIEGAIDWIDTNAVGGWARSADNSGTPLRVELWREDVLVGSMLAVLIRNDSELTRNAGFRFTEGGPFDLKGFESGTLKIMVRDGDVTRPLKVWSGVRLRLEKIRQDQEAKGRLVIIIGKQRSGTTVIGRLVASHPGAFYAGEVFHSVRGPQDDLEYKKYYTAPEVNFFVWRERLFARFPSLSFPSHHNQKAIWQEFCEFLFTHSPRKLVVVDVKLNSLHHLNTVWHDRHDQPNLLKLLAETRMPIISVARSDIFAQAVSALRAAQLKIYHAGITEATNSVPVELDPKKLEQRMAENVRAAGDIREMLRHYPDAVELEYSRCFEGEGFSDWASEQISRVTGIVDFAPGSSQMKKLTNSSIRDITPNAEEILNYFKNKPFEDAVRNHLG